MIPLPLPLLAAGAFWCFKQGISTSSPVAAVVRPILKPVLLSVIGGAVVGGPRNLTPFRVVGGAIAYTLGQSTGSSINHTLNSSTRELVPAFTLNTTGSFVNIGIRNDVYHLLSVTVRSVFVLGSLFITYRVSLKLIYLIRKDVDKNWGKNEQKARSKNLQ